MWCVYFQPRAIGIVAQSVNRMCVLVKPAGDTCKFHGCCMRCVHLMSTLSTRLNMQGPGLSYCTTTVLLYYSLLFYYCIHRVRLVENICSRWLGTCCNSLHVLVGTHDIEQYYARFRKQTVRVRTTDVRLLVHPAHRPQPPSKRRRSTFLVDLGHLNR